VLKCTCGIHRGQAQEVLGTAAYEVKRCKTAEGPIGRGKVSVTFVSSGDPTIVTVEGPPFAGTPLAWCIMATFGKVRVFPFEGPPVRVMKSFSIE
jgi:hypothetical protein